MTPQYAFWVMLLLVIALVAGAFGPGWALIPAGIGLALAIIGVAVA